MSLLSLRRACRLIAHICTAFVALTLATTANSQTVYRKGVTLAGPLAPYIANNFAELQRILDTRVGVVGINLAWFEATINASGDSVRPANPRSWNDPVYENNALIKQVDKITDYVKRNGNGAFVMMITFGTPGWANCPTDTGADKRWYPPANAADYGDYMYAMSERYNGTHVSAAGVAIGKARDWVVWNEVNSPSWWKNTKCNTSNRDPVYYYGGILNVAFDAVHHVAGTRVLAGAFTSYTHLDYVGNPGLRIGTSHSDWNVNSVNDDANGAWISPVDFVTKMKDYNLKFDAISHHPYGVKIYDSPFIAPPAGAITMANIGTLLQHLRTLYPSDQNKWHLVLGEYFQHSYYGDRVSSGPTDDNAPGIPCPNYFCASTSEANLKLFLQQAYSTSGSNRPYVDYLIWSLWGNVDGFTGGLVRLNGQDKVEGIASGSVRQAFTDINP